jgi:hypothetical protein
MAIFASPQSMISTLAEWPNHDVGGLEVAMDNAA